jgi:hypothetical protein
MEVEELTTSQLVLLVLLVSFVTSIATGIVTVSLLAQTPPAITQTINRVVERTVETIVPSENQSASVITKETTVVVKEDDLITESVGKGFDQIVRVRQNTATSSPVVALGAMVGKNTLVTDLALVSKEHAVLLGDTHYQFVVSKKIPELGIAFMTATGTPPNTGTFKGVDVSSLKLGQTVIGLYGLRSDRVALNVVSALSKAPPILINEDSIDVHFVETTISETMTPGTPLISIFGDLIGVSTSVSREDGKGSFISYGDIVNLLEIENTITAETEDPGA